MSKWETIPGYSDYQVSDAGQIRSVKFGRTMILKPSTAGAGYLVVDLCKNGKRKTCQIHRLVLAAFQGPCPDGKECNHKDGDKLNNRVENLKYVTRSENGLHAYRTGLSTPPGEKKVLQLTKDGQFIAEYKSQSEASRRTEAYSQSISACCNGRNKSAAGFVWRYSEKEDE